MGKSVFLLPSSNAVFNRTQLRKLRDELGGGLALEGIFSDKNEALEKLADQIRSRMNFGHVDVTTAVFFSLCPQNVPDILKASSWLNIPFIMGRSERIAPINCAGAIADSPEVEFREGKARPADYEEMILLLVAALRKLDIESYFSVFRFHESFQRELSFLIESSPYGSKGPCVLIPKNDGTLSLGMPLHPFLLNLPDRGVHSLEVLDSDSVKFLFELKNARMHASSLMSDVRDRKEEFPGERKIRSIQIGHAIHEGLALWKPGDAEWSIELAKTMFGDEADLESVRQKIEDTYVHPITCPVSHLMAAASVMADSDTVGNLAWWIRGLSSPTSFQELTGKLNQFGAHQKLLNYAQLAGLMNLHIHPPSECDGRGGN